MIELRMLPLHLYMMNRHHWIGR